MSAVDQRRNDVQAMLRPYGNPVTRARRAYFDNATFALAGKHEVEFEIKQRVADRYDIPFRSVVFTGSAQLGFSTHKDTEFIQGSSDLDIACIDSTMYQYFWLSIQRATRAFTDQSIYIGRDHEDNLKNHILKRGMILFDFLPKCADRTNEITFLDLLSRNYRSYFGRVTLAVYMNEHAFCWKQNSALSNILRYENAK